MSKNPMLKLTTSSGVPIAEIPASIRSTLSSFMARVELSDHELPSSIAMTSKLSGEGVSFMSAALATSMAIDLGRSVCLVDANFWSEPDELSQLNDGFVGLLRGEADEDDLAIATNIESFDIVVRGHGAETSPALVSSSDRLTEAINMLSERYDTVVLDLPALEVSPGAIRASGSTDGVVLVARHASVRVDQIEQAVEDLAEAKILGVLLNDFALKTPGIIRRRILDR